MIRYNAREVIITTNRVGFAAVPTADIFAVLKALGYVLPEGEYTKEA